MHGLRHHRLERGDAAYVASGAINISGESFPGRLQEIFGRVRALITEYQPGEVAVERVFLSKNADSALKLGQARGAALCGAFPRHGAVHEYAPRAIKLAVVGMGGAEKTQVAAHGQSICSPGPVKLGRRCRRRARRGDLPCARRQLRRLLRDDRMIGFLRGRLVDKTPPHLTVDVGGVGYEIEAPMSTFYTSAGGGQRSAAAHAPGGARGRAHPVRLRHRGERRLFRNLLKVSGVGPKIALAHPVWHECRRLRALR